MSRMRYFLNFYRILYSFRLEDCTTPVPAPEVRGPGADSCYGQIGSAPAPDKKGRLNKWKRHKYKYIMKTCYKLL